MKKVFKILGLIVLVFILIMTAISVFFGIVKVDEDYGRHLYQYRRMQICSECFNGARTGLCPEITQNDAGLEYPSAEEYKGEHLSIKGYAEVLNLSDEAIIKTHGCEGDLSADYNLFDTMPKPHRSYFRSILRQQDEVWATFGIYFFCGLLRLPCTM